MDVRKRITEGKSVRVVPMADAIGVSPSTLYEWIKKGEVRAYQLGASKIIPAEEGARLLNIGQDAVAA